MDILNQIDKRVFLRLVVLGLIILACYKFFFNGKQKIISFNSRVENLDVNWINEGFGYGYGLMNPADRLLDLVKEFDNPSFLNPKRGGSAVWNKEHLKGTPFERIEIKDEQIIHDKPKKHTDFLYSYYKIDIPEHKIGGLKKISNSIAYDPLKKIMTARCHDIKPNVVTHWIVKKYAEGHLEIDEAVGMYGPMIMEMFEDDQTGTKYRSLMSEL